MVCPVSTTLDLNQFWEVDHQYRDLTGFLKMGDSQSHGFQYYLVFWCNNLNGLTGCSPALCKHNATRMMHATMKQQTLSIGYWSWSIKNIHFLLILIFIVSIEKINIFESHMFWFFYWFFGSQSCLILLIFQLIFLLIFVVWFFGSSLSFCHHSLDKSGMPKGGSRHTKKPEVDVGLLLKVFQEHSNLVANLGTYETIGRSQSCHPKGLITVLPLIKGLLELSDTGEIHSSSLRQAMMNLLVARPSLNDTIYNGQVWCGSRCERIGVVLYHMRSSSLVVKWNCCSSPDRGRSAEAAGGGGFDWEEAWIWRATPAPCQKGRWARATQKVEKGNQWGEHWQQRVSQLLQ